MYQVNFAGVELSKVCSVLKVKREVLPARENFSKAIPTLHGSVFTGYKYKERYITLEVAIISKSKEEYTTKIRELAQILDTTNPSKLIISDEADKYYYAVVDGSTDIDKKSRTGTIEITFICHNPFALATKWNTYSPNNKGIISIVNTGSVEVEPIIDVDFRGDGCFFQVTNHKGETVLIGKPKDSTQPTKPSTDIIINDNCTSANTFTSIAESLLDSGRKITGQYGVGYNGNGIIATNYGNTQENSWYGAGFKRNLEADISEFEVEIDLVFSSEGKNYAVPPVPPVPPPPPTPEFPNPPSGNTYGTYEVYNCGGLWINATADVSQPLYPMAPGDKVYPVEIKNGWAKHTFSNKWNTFTGWSSMKYLRKISDSVIKTGEGKVVKQEYAEDELGMLEIYGFDKNGAKLFKASITDTNEFYEYVEPQVYFGGKLVLDDGKNCPAPRKIKVKDDSGKEEDKNVESGVFGEFNDLYGKVVIKREKNSTGTYLWSATVYKYKDGRIVNSITTQNSLSDNSFPKGDLNYLGFYMGKYDKHRAVDLVTVSNIRVRKLNMKTDNSTTDNLTIFKNNDHLQINFGSGLITLNDKVFLTQLDIGSEFFKLPTGKSEVAIRSDNKNAVVCCGFQEKFL